MGVSSCPSCQLNNLKDPSWPNMSNGMGLTMRRGLAGGLHPDASFSRVWIPISHDRYIHRMDWRLYHLDWKGWRGGKKQNKTKLLHEVISRFGLPRSLQSDNRTSFTSKVTQGVCKALGITYYLHCAWRPQSSGKVERVSQFLKSVMKDNPGDLPGMEGGFTNSSPPHLYCP